MLKFKPAFSFSSFSSSRGSLVPLCFLPYGWSHVHIWGYGYFSQQSWLQLVIHSDWPTFRMMYMMYCVLNKQADNIQPWHTPFSIVSHPVLTVASWPAYRSRRFLVAQMVKNPPAMQDTWVWSLGWEATWRREWLPTPVFSLWEFHRHRSLAGYTILGVTKSGTRLSD